MIPSTEGINQVIRNNKDKIDTNLISDGYHTIGELYNHRIILWIQLIRFKDSIVKRALGKSKAWKTKIHSDGTILKGWFLLGYGYEKGKQITYHLPDEYWEYCSFIDTIDKAPEFDGHSSSDVLERLKNL